MKKIIIGILIILLVGLTSFVGFYTYEGYNLYKKAIEEKSIVDRVEELKLKETYVTLEQISNEYKEQLLHSEDRRFYDHGAFDFIGLTRAVLKNIVTLSFSEGGSTITQQLAKNLLFDYRQNLERKFGEIFAANKLEDLYTKDEIFELYMNITYFGNGCYGIEEASQYYYHKPAIDLNSEESKALVHTVKSPNNYNPKKLGLVSNDYNLILSI